MHCICKTCGSYRPITLLSVPGKVFAHVLLAQLQPLFNSLQRPQQCGFTAGRSTIDAILALWLLSEIDHEFNQPLHVADIDLKAAFDLVNCLALWKVLCASGTPLFLVQLLEDLHWGTKSRVWADGQLSEPFDTTSGVRQGCALAPALFCIAGTGFSTDAQSSWVSPLVLLTLQIKPMPMMVFCSPTARPNG